jgi:ApbE superfamily uncharacterized protein (UPF0280 family)
MPLKSRHARAHFDVEIQDMLLRVAAPEDLYEEARAAGMHFWEQMESYGVRHREFRTSKRPVAVADDAPEIVREMAESARLAGVGPAFTIQGAVTDCVGRFLALRQSEVLVSNGGDFFAITRKRGRLVVHPGTEGGAEAIAIVVKPELGAQGISTTMGRLYLPSSSTDGLIVVATSCILADAAAAAASAILRREDSLKTALQYLQKIDGVHGAMVVRGQSIGLAGNLEVAA